MLPLIVRPAITTLGHMKPGSPAFNLWVGLLFYIPNLAGGVFGLLGGYFTDRWGRRRILFWSILLYSLSACAASYSTSLTQLLILRSTTIIGISVEFVAAITWLAELFPDGRRRESVLGGTQAFSALGGLMATGAYYLSVTHAESMPAIRGGHEAWRYTLLSGLIPAVPLLLVRPFLPESPLWREKRSMGGLKRPALSELFQPALRRTTIVTTLLFACSFALAFGALQQTVRMIPGLAEVQKLAPRQIEQAVSGVQLFQELGGLTGRILFAFLIVRIVSQRRRLRLLFVPAFFVFSWLYFFAATRSLAFVDIGIFVATMLFNGLHSCWGNYLPRVYPTRLRGTGESFAANIGGRVIGVSAALVTTTVSNVMPGGGPAARLAYSAGAVSLIVVLAGLVVISLLPEPVGNQLPD
jgi:MFS family permease